MRISDWSSDVCSSDLRQAEIEADLHDVLPSAAGRGEGGAVLRIGVERIGQTQETIVAIVQDLRRRAAVIGEHIGKIARVEILLRRSVRGKRRGNVEQKAVARVGGLRIAPFDERSEEHTSELQALIRITYACFSYKKTT